MIKNITKKTIIAIKSDIIGNIFSKFIGLMFSKRRNQGLIFKFGNEKIIDLHMFFVFYRIDVLFLNKNKIVVDKKESFKPFTFYRSRKRAMYAIELPENTIKIAKTEIGDKINF